MPKHAQNHHSRTVQSDHALIAAKSRMLKRNLLFLAITAGTTATLALCAKAQAAGGAYVVDDGAINAPRECNVDLWHQSARHKGSNHDNVIASACTFNQLPWLQLGAALQRQYADGSGETQVNPQIKVQLLNRQDLGLQLALAGSARWARRRAHGFDGGDLSLPVTFNATDSVRLHLNVGWAHAYDDSEQNHRSTWGIASEYDLTQRLTLIAQRYGEQGGEQGWQGGPRLHAGQHLDLDLIVGQCLTKGCGRLLTTGATFRF